ncbi:MAG: NYN domain-containing protein [Planctomycetota bacterium]
MHYVIDGYNFGHCAGIIKQNERKDAVVIVHYIMNLQALSNRGNEATIVFDGGDSSVTPLIKSARCRVIYSHKESADEVIKKRLESVPRALRRNYLTITNDRSLGAYARSLGVRVAQVDKFILLKSKKLLKKYETASEKPTFISREDVELAKIFEQGLKKKQGEHKNAFRRTDNT